jgi:hypothetical protein
MLEIFYVAKKLDSKLSRANNRGTLKFYVALLGSRSIRNAVTRTLLDSFAQIVVVAAHANTPLQTSTCASLLLSTKQHAQKFTPAQRTVV